MTAKPSSDSHPKNTALTPEIVASGCAVVALLLGFNALIILLAGCIGGFLALTRSWRRKKLFKTPNSE